jgi:hypothetical protein
MVAKKRFGVILGKNSDQMCSIQVTTGDFFVFFAVSNVFPSISQGIPQAPNISTLLAHTVPTTDV